MMRKTMLRLTGVAMLGLLTPLAVHAQGMGGGTGGTSGGTTTGGSTGGATTSSLLSGYTGGATSSTTTSSGGTSSTDGGASSSSSGGGGAQQGQPGETVSAAIGANLVKSAPIYSAVSADTASATTLPSNSNFLYKTYVNPLSLGLPSNYAATYGAKNVINEAGGPQGKFTYLYVPVPATSSTKATTTTTTAPGFSTYGISRAPVYSTVLSEDLPLVKHDSTKLLTTLRSELDRSSAIKDKSKVNVSVQGGNVVMLTGTVATEKEYRIAEGRIRMTPGVVDVRNELKILNGKK